MKTRNKTWKNLDNFISIYEYVLENISVLRWSVKRTKTLDYVRIYEISSSESKLR